MKEPTSSNDQAYGLFYIKLGCLLFFACWFFLACLTNIFDFINAVHSLPHWAFRSGNYDALSKVLALYHTPSWLLTILFTFDILTQAASAILFFISFACFFRSRTISPVINMSFGISMALWAVFIIMEEIFIAYSFESTHVRLFAFELLTLLSMHLLPHK